MPSVTKKLVPIHSLHANDALQHIFKKESRVLLTLNASRLVKPPLILSDNRELTNFQHKNKLYFDNVTLR